MRYASLVINDLKSNLYLKTFKKVYIDETKVSQQKQRYLDAVYKFIELYGDQEIEIYSVPGRSEVCGNHTDHQHGEVVAAAINLDILAVVAKADRIKILSDDYDIQPIYLYDLEKKKSEEGTSEGLIRGVLARFTELGLNTGGFVGYMTSDVLQGSGLSSSAAFEVMIGTILSGLYNEMSLDPVLLAQIGQYSENVYFGKPSGLMDQCACSVGSLIHIDFENINHPFVEKIEADFSQYQHSLCIVDVHASHADLTADYASIPNEIKEVAHYFGKDVLREINEDEFYKRLPELRKIIKNDRAILRCIHFYEEEKRVKRVVKALKRGYFKEFKAVIQASGNSSFKYLQNIYSNHDVNQQALSLALALSERILDKHGVCRVHGGGFAGTMQAFVEDEFVDTYKKEIENVFGKDSCHVLKIRSYGGIKVSE